MSKFLGVLAAVMLFSLACAPANPFASGGRQGQADREAQATQTAQAGQVVQAQPTVVVPTATRPPATSVPAQPTTPPASTATRPPVTNTVVPVATNTSVPPTVAPTQTPVTVVATQPPAPPQATPTPWVIVVTATPNPVQPTQTPRVVVATPSVPNNPTQPSATPATVRPPTGGNLQPQPGSPVSGGVCRLDKIGTWSEVSAAGPQRIEVGGGGTQHTDFYPNRGVKAVSYIVSPREPMIWMGFGSIWEGNGPDCQAFDWVKDATEYAKVRLDNGHSGLVIDLRGSTPVLVANVVNMSQPEIASLLATHLASMSGTVGSLSLQGSNAAAVAVTPTSGSSVGSTASGQGCPRAIETTFVSPTTFSPNAPAILHLWWNSPTPWGQTQVRVLLNSGSVTILGGMGKVYAYEQSEACIAGLDKEFANGASLPVKTVSDLKSAGLAR